MLSFNFHVIRFEITEYFISYNYNRIHSAARDLVRTCQGNGEYCIVVVVGWDAEEAAMRFHGFRGRGQASRVPWL